MFATPNEITVKGHFDSLNNLTIKGSALHNEYLAYRKLISTRSDSLIILDKLIAQYSNSGGGDLADSLSGIYESIALKRLEALKEYAQKNPESWIIPYFLERTFIDAPDEQLVNEILHYTIERCKSKAEWKYK